MRTLFALTMLSILCLGVSCKNLGMSGEGSTDGAKSSLDGNMDSVDGKMDAAKTGTESAAGGLGDALAGMDVGKILSADFSVEDVKDLVGKLEVPQLEGLAKGVLSAFEGSQGTVAKLTDSLDGATGAQKSALESQLGEAEASSDGILEKLRVLIDGISQKGGDVSGLTASLNKLLG